MKDPVIDKYGVLNEEAVRNNLAAKDGKKHLFVQSIDLNLATDFRPEQIAQIIQDCGFEILDVSTSSNKAGKTAFVFTYR